MQGCPSGLFGNGPVSLSPGLQLLIDEHPALREQMDHLLSLSNKVEANEEQDTTFEQLKQEVIDFSTKLEKHSQREEDYLFRMMETYIGKGQGPIAVMEYEHEQAHGMINEFLKSAENSKTPESKVKNATLIKNAVYTLQDHFQKEEQVLYPMAENMLSSEEKDDLLKKVTI